jgi:hypothetical protein
MSYGGGTVTQPILGGFGDLATMLLQGSSEIAQINLEISKRRDQQAASLAESISKITSTGITTHDKLIQQGARDAVNRLAQAFEANKRGEISLSEVSAMSSQLDSEVGILSNMAKLQDENIKNIAKGVEDEDLDSISFDYQNNLWYTDPNLKNDVFTSPATNADGTIKTNPDGTPMMVRRPSMEGLQTQRINGVLSVVKIKEVPLRDENGNPQFDPKTGAPLTTNKTFSQPLTEFLNPSLKKVSRYDLVDDVKGFQSITGKQFMYVDKNTGEITDMPYSQLGQTANGTIVQGYTIAPQNFPSMIRKVESYIGSPKDDEVISILHSYMKARADWQPDYGIPRSADEVNESNMMEIMVDNELTIIPKYYDMNGESLQFTSDPLDLQTDGSGKIMITEEQRELAKAFKRDQILTSFNVDYKDFKEYIDGKKSSTRIPATVSYNQAVWSKSTPSEVNNTNPLDSDYISNRLAIVSHGRDEFSKGVSAGPNATRNAISTHNNGQIVSPVIISTATGQVKNLYDRRNDVVGGFSLVYASTPSKPGDDIRTKIMQDLKGTTASGGTLKSVQNILFMDEGVLDNKNVSAQVLIEGTIDLASTATSTTDATGASTGSMAQKQSVSVSDFYVVDTNELPSLYRKLWDQGKGPKSFRSILEGKGFNVDGNFNGASNQWLKAFEYYTEQMNPKPVTK